MDEENVHDIPNDPKAEGHLPTAGEIVVEDTQISNDIIDELNGDDEE